MPHPVCSTTLKSRRAKHGFALIIALTLMTFLLMLVLSLSSIIAVDTQTAASAASREQAKRNALLALHLALGELQKFAGPDQRVTATSALLDTNPETAAIDGISQSHWTGVWDEDGKLLTWLVSGNKGRTPSDANFVTPKNDPNGINMYSDGSVNVPLEEVDSSEAYAYWISDEGVKAKVTLPDASVVANPLLSAQMVDITQVSDLEWLSDIASQMESRRRAISIEALKILATDAGSKTSIDNRRHDLTAHSYGLLTNSAGGGLKQDLTLALYDGSGLPSGQIFGAVGGASTLLDPGGPRWQQLQSWVQSAGAGSLQVRPQTDDQTGLYPVITQFQYYLIPRYLDDAVSGERKIYIEVYPAVTLWNPYDRAIESTGYLLDIGKTAWKSAADASNNNANSSQFSFYAGGLFQWIMRLYGNDGAVDFTHDYHWSATNVGSWIAGSPIPFPNPQNASLHFSIVNVALQPGESVTFSPAGAPDTRSLMTLESSDIEKGPNDFTYYPLEKGFRLTNSYYFDPGISYAKLSDGTFPELEFILFTATQLNDSVRLMDANHRVLQEVLLLSGFSNSINSGYTMQRANVESLGATDIDGALGRKVSRLFSDSSDLAKWVATANPRAATNSAAPLFFHKQSEDNVHKSRMLSNGFYATMDKGAEHQVGLNAPGTGTDVNSGINTVLFESAPPRANLQSIGQLMHAPLYYSGASGAAANANDVAKIREDTGRRLYYARSDNYLPAYAIGNSEADPQIALDARYVDWSINDFSNDAVKAIRPLNGRHYDYSYYLNNALWDGYFFSALPAASSRQSANPRLVARNASGTTALSSKNAAAEFLVDGAFNINSTSEEAWRALLGAFYGEKSVDSVPASPFVRALGGSDRAFDPANDDAGDEEAYDGFRALTKDQIVNLAHQIVKQIKWRQLGRERPFTSLADFVNRDPANDAPSEMGDDNALRLRGALSAALRAADAIDDAKAAELGINKDRARINAALQGNSYKTEAPSVSGFTEEALAGWYSEGIAGWLTQADLLARLGGILTARSDTFKIRVYGESRNPTTGEPNATAWGEAVVQRLPQFVDSAANSADASADDLSPENKAFGRRFVIVDFHWLD